MKAPALRYNGPLSGLLLFLASKQNPTHEPHDPTVRPHLSAGLLRTVGQLTVIGVLLAFLSLLKSCV